MVDELEFRSLADIALDALMQHLIVRETEDEAGFEVEGQGGLLTVVFEEPAGKFVITPNAPVRQIWISALSTSFKLDWDEAARAYNTGGLSRLRGAGLCAAEDGGAVDSAGGSIDRGATGGVARFQV